MRKGRVRKSVMILTICVMVFTLFPMTASALVYQHNMYYNLNGGATFWNLRPIYNVRDNETFTIDGQTPFKDYYNFKGYYAYRMKDAKWYVSGKGWVTSNSGAKLYQPGQSYRLDSSWRTGCKNSDYKFYAQWDPKSYTVRYQHASGTIISKWTKKYKYQTSIYIDKGTTKNGKQNIGWNLSRDDNGTVTWYVSGIGWVDQRTIDYYGYTKKLYTRYSSYKLDGSWLKDSYSEYPTFTFKAVY